MDRAAVVADYPLAADHWLNASLGREAGFRTLLQVAIEEGTLDSVQLLVQAGARADLYNDDLGLATVHVACQMNRLDMLRVLLGEPKNCGDLNARMRNGQTCLHIAAEHNSLEFLVFLLESGKLDTVDPEELRGRQTPLYLAVKNKHEKSIRILLEHGASLLNTVENITIRDHLKNSLPHCDPDLISVRVKPKESTEQDLLYSLAKILDKAQLARVRKNGGLTSEESLVHFRTLVQALVGRNRQLINSFSAGRSTLLQKACDLDLHDFVQVLLEYGADPNTTLEENTARPVMIAAYNGSWQVVEVLLNHRAQAVDGVPSVQLDIQDRATKETILHHILKRPRRSEGVRFEEGYQRCLQLLLSSPDKSVQQEIDRTINRRDSEGNTPLHCAILQWSQATVRELLERGANIGVKNRWEETPIARILPETMEAFLDEFCLTSKNEVQHENFQLRFRYAFLAPPVDNPCFDETDVEGQQLVERMALPETESLWYMAQSKSHRHLLKHPVITSFLWMKWQRIRKHFNRNLRLYLLFVTVLTWYIFERFGGVSYRRSADRPPDNSSSSSTPPPADQFCAEKLSSDDQGRGFWFVVFLLQSGCQLGLIIRDWHRDLKQSDLRVAFQVLLTSWVEFFIITAISVLIIFGAESLSIILTILLALVFMREVLQMMVSLKRYVFDLENVVELVMIGLVAIILFPVAVTDGGSDQATAAVGGSDIATAAVGGSDLEATDWCGLKRHLAAIALVLGWATLITLVGRHPKLSSYNIYVTMFYKVMRSFILFLTWYSFFILAFGLGFYIMLHKDVPGHVQAEEEYKFFNNPWLSLVKTATMFIGEIEFSDIPIDLDSGLAALAYLFLLSFIFLIVVVLMNLLNGLAVSDTGLIREEAEIVTYISRVETISCTEAVLLGDPFNFLSNWPAIKALRSLPSLAFCRSLYRNDLVRDISHKITGATGILLFYSWLPTKELILHPNRGSNDCPCLGQEDLSEEIIRSAKSIVIRKSQARLAEAGQGIEAGRARLEHLEAGQARLEESMRALAAKMDLILSKL